MVFLDIRLLFAVTNARDGKRLRIVYSPVIQSEKTKNVSLEFYDL